MCIVDSSYHRFRQILWKLIFGNVELIENLEKDGYNMNILEIGKGKEPEYRELWRTNSTPLTGKTIQPDPISKYSIDDPENAIYLSFNHCR